MNEIINNVVAQYGAIGMLIFVLLYTSKQLLSKLDKKEELHRVERNNFYLLHGQLTDKVIESTDRNTTVLIELKTLIKQIK